MRGRRRPHDRPRRHRRSARRHADAHQARRSVELQVVHGLSGCLDGRRRGVVQSHARRRSARRHDLRPRRERPRDTSADRGGGRPGPHGPEVSCPHSPLADGRRGHPPGYSAGRAGPHASVRRASVGGRGAGGRHRSARPRSSGTRRDVPALFVPHRGGLRSPRIRGGEVRHDAAVAHAGAPGGVVARRADRRPSSRLDGPLPVLLQRAAVGDAQLQAAGPTRFQQDSQRRARGGDTAPLDLRRRCAASRPPADPLRGADRDDARQALWAFPPQGHDRRRLGCGPCPIRRRGGVDDPRRGGAQSGGLHALRGASGHRASEEGVPAGAGDRRRGPVARQGRDGRIRASRRMREGVKRASHGRIPEVAEMENPMESWRNRKTLILSRTDMMGLVTPAEYVSCVEQAYRMHGEGRYFMEPKGHIVLDKYPGEWEAMPSYIEEPEAAACKWVSIREQNRERFDLPTVFSILIYTHPETGFPLAICDGSFHTVMRTGAAAAVSVRWMARPDAQTLAIVGAGHMAQGTLATCNEVVKWRDVRVWSRTQPSLDRFIQSEQPKYDRFRIRGSTDLKQVVQGADVIVTVTPARAPLVMDEWVADGAHIAALGADKRGDQELDPRILKRARIFVDDLRQCRHDGGINVPLAAGLLTERDIAGEIGEIIVGRKRGRTSASEITVFDSTGIALQDSAPVPREYERALAAGVGIEKKMIST